MVHVQLGPKWRDLLTKLCIFFFSADDERFSLLSYLNMNNIMFLSIFVSVLRFFIISSNLQYLKDNVYEENKNAGGHWEKLNGEQQTYKYHSKLDYLAIVCCGSE